MNRAYELAAALLLYVLAMPVQAAEPVLFDWFEYRGHDAVFDAPLPPGGYRNPILAGFHPDPAITRAGNRYYLVSSTFTFFPGIPVFESADLVHWTQIGNVIDRPSQLDFDGLGISRGVFAPAIEFHDGVFYVLNTAVDSGGNFIATATNPAGPWSDPIWLPTIDGIDPSIFFDSDGKTYLLNNGPPEGTPRYEGHRAIWMQQFDMATHEAGRSAQGADRRRRGSVEEPDLDRRPAPLQARWLVLPDVRRRRHSVDHSQVILRSRAVWGPYQPYENNPILTQRDLAPDRADPVINAGHADWWKAWTAAGGRSSWPAEATARCTSTPAAKPTCCPCSGRMAGR